MRPAVHPDFPMAARARMRTDAEDPAGFVEQVGADVLPEQSRR